MSASRPVRGLLLATVAVSLAGSVTALSPSSVADTRPTAGVPATVSSDALPTWQINGVVYSQVTVGNVVYATGSFSKARPAGVAPGGPGEVAARNIFAYDIRTGWRVASFHPSLNAAGRVITASPDGKQVYVGGDFTRVNGRHRGHVAAFKTSSKALVPTFKPSTNGTVRSLAVTRKAVYLGGDFSRMSGTVRHRLAKVAVGSGKPASWKPRADGLVLAMVLAPGGKRLIVGGSFAKLSGRSELGMGSLSTSTGAVKPWAANRTIRVGGKSAAVTSLATDGRLIFGSGYTYAPVSAANFEGTFAAAPSSGKLAWVDNCHGDTLDVHPIGKVLYSVGHPHDCSPIGEFPQSTPEVYWKALASTTYATGMNNAGPDSYGWNYTGLRAAHHLTWYPDLANGTYTGLGQAAWSVTGNRDYVALGGEFPSVNGTPQQGLVRFARTGLAPDKQGAVSSSFALTATPAAGYQGRVDLSWASQWDADNASLTYQVLRDGAPLGAAITSSSTFWNRPTLSLVDTAAPVGKVSYQVQVRDPFGNTTLSPVVKATVAAPPA